MWSFFLQEMEDNMSTVSIYLNMYTLDGVKDGLYCREIYFIILKLLQRALYYIYMCT